MFTLFQGSSQALLIF